MPAMFSMHMAAHMLLSMLVPILLVLGAPGDAGAAGAAGRGTGRAARAAGMAAGRVAFSRVSRFLTNPIVATVLFVAGLLRAVLRRHLRRRGRAATPRTSR